MAVGLGAKSKVNVKMIEKDFLPNKTNNKCNAIPHFHGILTYISLNGIMSVI